MKFIEPLPKQLNKDHDVETKQNRENPYEVANSRRDSSKNVSILLIIICSLVVIGLILLIIFLFGKF